MSSQFFRDSNYESICPYCLEGFVANHAIRRYCAEKNGSPDYCKNRFDKQIKNLTLLESNSVYKRSDVKEEYQRLYNIQVLHNMYNEEFFSVSASEFLKLKYVMTIYDRREVFGQEPFYLIHIGPFQLEWKQELLITILKLENHE
jgi:hypothetical protein